MLVYEQNNYLEMMHMVPNCSSPQPLTSSNFDFDLDLLPADGEVPDLGLPADFSFSLDHSQGLSALSYLDYQVPSPTLILSPIEAGVHSPTMFSPYDGSQKSPGAKANSLGQSQSATGGHRYVQMASPVSLPPASPYSPAMRPQRLSSTDSNKTSSSTTSIMQESFAEFQELQNKIKREQDVLSPPPPPPPYNIATRGTLNIKIEPCDNMSSIATASVPQQESSEKVYECQSPFTPPHRFQFKPMDFGSFSGGNHPCSSSSFEQSLGLAPKPLMSMAGQAHCLEVSSTRAEQDDVSRRIGPVLSMAMDEVKNDIEASCRKLGISHDPTRWSPIEVRKWLSYTLDQNDIALLPNPNGAFELWATMEGKQFSQISEDEFKEMLPQGGLVYDQLDLWKSNAHYLSQEASSHDSMGASTSGLIPLNQIKKEDSLDFSYVLQMLDNKEEALTSPSPQANATYTRAPITSGSVSHTLSPPPPPYPSTSTSFDSSTSHATTSGAPQLTSQGPLSNDTTTTDYGSEHFEDDDHDDDDVEMEHPTSVGPGSAHSGSPRATPPTVVPGPTGRTATNIHLWQFVKELLNQPQLYSGCIHWIDKEKGIFKIVDSTRVATLWGQRKNRPAMNYDKLSRSLRQYYKKGIMKKTERTQRLVYQFCHPYHL